MSKICFLCDADFDARKLGSNGPNEDQRRNDKIENQEIDESDRHRLEIIRSCRFVKLFNGRLDDRGSQSLDFDRKG